jgi:hypothetical protein
MLAIIVAVVAGAWVAVAGVALGFPQPLVVAAGVAGFLITLVGNAIWGQRTFVSLRQGITAQFPSSS